MLTVNVTFSATITCTVFAIPLPSIMWIKNGSEVISEEGIGRVIINQTDSGDTRTSVLHFNHTVKADESNYTCVAVNNITNIINTPESGTVNLIVQGIHITTIK